MTCYPRVGDLRWPLQSQVFFMVLFRLPLVLVLVAATGFGCGNKDAGAGGNMLFAFHVERPEWCERARNDVPMPCHAEHPDAGLIVHWSEKGVLCRRTDCAMGGMVLRDYRGGCDAIAVSTDSCLPSPGEIVRRSLSSGASRC